jgi:hypothetical protein
MEFFEVPNRGIIRAMNLPLPEVPCGKCDRPSPLVACRHLMIREWAITKAMRDTGLSFQKIATLCGVNQHTVLNWFYPENRFKLNERSKNLYHAGHRLRQLARCKSYYERNKDRKREYGLKNRARIRRRMNLWANQ